MSPLGKIVHKTSHVIMNNRKRAMKRFLIISQNQHYDVSRKLFHSTA